MILKMRRSRMKSKRSPLWQRCLRRTWQWGSLGRPHSLKDQLAKASQCVPSTTSHSTSGRIRSRFISASDAWSTRKKFTSSTIATRMNSRSLKRLNRWRKQSWMRTSTCQGLYKTGKRTSVMSCCEWGRRWLVLSMTSQRGLSGRSQRLSSRGESYLLLLAKIEDRVIVCASSRKDLKGSMPYSSK